MTADPVPDSAYRLDVSVHPDDIDQLEHVNNLVYLRWVQDAAIAHWDALATDDMKQELFWVVSRHEIDYLRSAVLGDPIQVHTWIGAEVAGFFERHTRIDRVRHDADGAEQRVVLARVRTLWCPMSWRTGRRVTQVSEPVRALFATD